MHLPAVPGDRASSSGFERTSCNSVALSSNILFAMSSMRLIKNMAQNEHAKTQVWLPIENEAEIEIDTKTKLSFDDEW